MEAPPGAKSMGVALRGGVEASREYIFFMHPIRLGIRFYYEAVTCNQQKQI
jgi:hypothetical protein